MKNYKKYLIAILLLSFAFVPAFAKEDKPIGTIQQQISLEGMPQGISFITGAELKLLGGKVIIPKGSTVYAKVIDSQGERRWHKSGFIICKLKGYTTPNPQNTEDEDYTNIERKDIYMVARKYEAIDKKQAGKTAAEVTATTAAGIVIPGIDIAYYFTKGMIKKQDDLTRFKSGVHCAYENSIFWFWLKGKPIDLEENASIKFTEISEERAEKLQEQIEKRKERSEKMQERKEAVKEFMSY